MSYVEGEAGVKHPFCWCRLWQRQRDPEASSCGGSLAVLKLLDGGRDCDLLVNQFPSVILEV